MGNYSCEDSSNPSVIQVHALKVQSEFKNIFLSLMLDFENKSQYTKILNCCPPIIPYMCVMILISMQCYLV